MSNDKSSGVGAKAKSHQKHDVEVVKQSSPLDYVLWALALALLFGAVMGNTLLPKYWVAANDIWVRIGTIAGFIVLAIGLLYLTQQGKAFVQLLKDARIELRRVIWPSKDETINTSWQVIIVVLIAAGVMWLLDTVFSLLMKFIIG